MNMQKEIEADMLTRLGEVYASRDDGDSWRMITGHLPDILSVRVAAIA